MVVDPPPTTFSASALVDYSRFTCLEKQKPVFKVALDVVSSVHSLDDALEKFLELTRCLEKEELPEYLESTDGEDVFRLWMLIMLLLLLLLLLLWWWWWWWW